MLAAFTVWTSKTRALHGMHIKCDEHTVELNEFSVVIFDKEWKMSVLCDIRNKETVKIMRALIIILSHRRQRNELENHKDGIFWHFEVKSVFFFCVMLFHMSLFRLELESYTATALISIPAFAYCYLLFCWLITFYNIPKGTTIIGKYYIDVLMILDDTILHIKTFKRYKKCVTILRSFKLASWQLQKLEELGYQFFPHPPYLPGVVPWNYNHFLYLKK
jgi:hypothetical protein